MSASVVTTSTTRSLSCDPAKKVTSVVVRRKLQALQPSGFPQRQQHQYHQVGHHQRLDETPAEQGGQPMPRACWRALRRLGLRRYPCASGFPVPADHPSYGPGFSSQSEMLSGVPLLTAWVGYLFSACRRVFRVTDAAPVPSPIHRRPSLTPG